MKVQDVMTKKLISVSPEENACVAARLLSHYNIGALPVCTKDGKLRGMVTDRDIVLRCVAAEEDPQTTKISDIMTRRVFSVASEESLDGASALMAREKVRRLPVEANHKIVGMVSLSDITKHSQDPAGSLNTLNQISENMRMY